MNDISHQQVLEELRDIVADVTDGELSEDQFRPDMSVLEDVGLNSVDFLELAFEIEKKWDITISDDEFRTFKTVDDVIRMIVVKVNDKSQQAESTGDES